MAKFRYYSNKGFAVADYADIDTDDIIVSEYGVVSLLDDDALKAIIHLAPGERLERVED
jgi:hypothetical protein